MAYTCGICKESFSDSDTYEYRGFFFCHEHFDEGIKKVDWRRSEIMQANNAKLSSLAGLDLKPDSVIGKANRELLKAKIEIAGKESGREKDYRQGIL